ncbi:MAG: Nif3-like dinuclear metal center hexameric protein [Clostridia bacterium]|nr:Nif3-like dinuclear metal center hexameric protein [Clostridia bacterium]
MLAKEIYKKLDIDFTVDSLKDDWSFMEFNEFIHPLFRKRHMGLMLDNAQVIKKVYTAVFPDREIIDKILEEGQADVLLFSHHAMGYDGSVEGFPFYSIPNDKLQKMVEQRVSFYVLHVPLDKNGYYSTAYSLANALRLDVVDDFCEYFGVKIGVVCKTDKKTVWELVQDVKGIIGHDVKLINYGEESIKGGRIAIAAGGGSYPFVAEELVKLGINLYLTGFTRPLPSFEPTMEFHRIVEENKINVIGATHYSTEKYACMAMVEYFKRMGLPAAFIEGRPYLEDL